MAQLFSLGLRLWYSTLGPLQRGRCEALNSVTADHCQDREEGAEAQVECQKFEPCILGTWRPCRPTKNGFVTSVCQGSPCMGPREPWLSSLAPSSFRAKEMM